LGGREPQRGDEGELFAEFNDSLMRAVQRRVRTSRDNVEDACAIAWSTFLRRQPDRNRNWRGWLVTVAVREAIRLDRRDRDEVAILEPGEEPDAHRAFIGQKPYAD
jgi:DNA-directed RNA polymerase specialized sigma24 family protein